MNQDDTLNNTAAPTSDVSDDMLAGAVAADGRSATSSSNVFDQTDQSVVAPDLMTSAPKSVPPSDSEIVAGVVKKIADANNVLVALSSDPSVDEMAAAIGLTLFLDKLGKRATAIYSGSTPNALEFLRPEATFETSADVLQDFVIALNKEKADHLRYKLDGDYVKIYVTPYKAKISGDDLELAYGDYNVDLVIALNVANGIDLDSALREHGRIMHDASIINITTNNPGKFGEIEWSDKNASSISEMVAGLLYDAGGSVKIENEEATAFLTGIVAATNRFSNTKTTPKTLQIASKLMESGANQQMVSKNIVPDLENEMRGTLKGNARVKQDNDPTKLDIEHENRKEDKQVAQADAGIAQNDLVEDLKGAEADLSSAGVETVPEMGQQPVKIQNDIADARQLEEELRADEEMLRTDGNSVPGAAMDAEANNVEIGPQEGSTMMSEGPVLPEVSVGDGNVADVGLGDMGGSNPAQIVAPEVAGTQDVYNTPEMNYMPLPGQEVLPPPPTPPIDMNTPTETIPVAPGVDMSGATTPENPANKEAIAPAMSEVQEEPAYLGQQPAMQDQVYTPQAADPGAFQIPGAQ